MRDNKISSLFFSLAAALAVGWLMTGCKQAPNQPTIIGPSATAQSNTVATLNVAVNPNPTSSTDVRSSVALFQYGILPDTSLPLQQLQNIYPYSTSPEDVGRDNAFANVFSQVGNLTPGVVYRAVAAMEREWFGAFKSRENGTNFGIATLLFGSPAIALNGAANVTNNVGTPFTDPGATATFGLRAIAAGFTHSLALKSDGTVVGWGDNANGQTNAPVGLSNVVAIAAGGYSSLP